MGDITKNISQYELDCKCGKPYCKVTIHRDEPIIKIWQGACDHFAKINGADRVSLVITSAARCYEYNRIPTSEGGPGSSDRSRHPRGDAIDGKIFVGSKQIAPWDVYHYFDSKHPDSLGVGMYSSFTHCDTRQTGKARW